MKIEEQGIYGFYGDVPYFKLLFFPDKMRLKKFDPETLFHKIEFFTLDRELAKTTRKLGP